MSKIALIIGFVFVMVASNVRADPGSASGIISRIVVKETGYVLVYFTTPHANPTGCQENNVVAIAQSQIGKKEMLSVALLAKTTGKNAGFWVTDCYAAYGTTYPLGVTASIN